MKLMPALPESIFDIGYLAFAIISGVLMLKKAQGRRLAKLFGTMALVLGCEQAVALAKVQPDARKGVLLATWILAAVRIVLCCLPQNAWASENPPLLWGILRNIPFVIMGVMCVILWAISAKEDKPLRFLWLYVLLSFAFYIPVVLFAQSVPIIGMLMLPKTVMYILMIVSFKKSLK